MKLKKLSVGLMTAVLTAGLLASPAMASEVTDAAAVQNGTVTVQAAATENGTAGTGHQMYSGRNQRHRKR